MTEGFLQWGLRYAGRDPNTFDRVVPLAYSGEVPASDAVEEAETFWRQLDVGCDPNEFVICFFGNVSRRTELRDVIRAAKLVEGRAPECRFVLCGKGEDLSECRRLASCSSNVRFPGRVGAAEIWTLMRQSKMGIVPYLSTQDFVKSIPNKAIEYLSAGLPILTSLRGTLEDLIREQQCGVRYENGNPEMLADWITNLSANPVQVASMSRRAKELFDERFVAEKVYGELVRHLECAARHGHRVRSDSPIRLAS